MSYPAGEAVVLTLLQAMSEFDRRNTARGDWKPLNSGGSDHYAIIRPGPFANKATALGGASVTAWRTIIEVWQRWVDDAPTVLALEGLVSAVIDHLERYPGLDGLALIAGVTGGGEMQQRWLREGGPGWAVQEIYYDWQEERFTPVD